MQPWVNPQRTYPPGRGRHPPPRPACIPNAPTLVSSAFDWEEGEMLHLAKRSGTAVVSALLAAALLGISPGHAGLLQPQPIDANTGQDALDVGASFGSKQAWPGLGQGTHFYVAHAP